MLFYGGNGQLTVKYGRHNTFKEHPPGYKSASVPIPHEKGLWPRYAIFRITSLDPFGLEPLAGQVLHFWWILWSKWVECMLLQRFKRFQSSGSINGPSGGQNKPSIHSTLAIVKMSKIRLWGRRIQSPLVRLRWNWGQIPLGVFNLDSCWMHLQILKKMYHRLRDRTTVLFLASAEEIWKCRSNICIL